MPLFLGMYILSTGSVSVALILLYSASGATALTIALHNSLYSDDPSVRSRMKDCFEVLFAYQSCLLVRSTVSPRVADCQLPAYTFKRARLWSENGVSKAIKPLNELISRLAAELNVLNQMGRAQGHSRTGVVENGHI